MEKQKNGELSRMFGYAGKFHVLTVLGCVLSGISTILSMLPFVCTLLLPGIYLLQRGAPIMRGWRLCLQRQAF